MPRLQVQPSTRACPLYDHVMGCSWNDSVRMRSWICALRYFTRLCEWTHILPTCPCACFARWYVLAWNIILTVRRNSTEDQIIWTRSLPNTNARTWLLNRSFNRSYILAQQWSGIKLVRQEAMHLLKCCFACSFHLLTVYRFALQFCCFSALPFRLVFCRPLFLRSALSFALSSVLFGCCFCSGCWWRFLGWGGWRQEEMNAFTCDNAYCLHVVLSSACLLFARPRQIIEINEKMKSV